MHLQLQMELLPLQHLNGALIVWAPQRYLSWSNYSLHLCSLNISILESFQIPNQSQDEKVVRGQSEDSLFLRDYIGPPNYINN